MTLEQIKKHLSTAEAVNFELENGTTVPEHFHVTEVGVVTKHFIDCGGTIRNEKVANFQLWETDLPRDLWYHWVPNVHLQTEYRLM